MNQKVERDRLLAKSQEIRDSERAEKFFFIFFQHHLLNLY